MHTITARWLRSLEIDELYEVQKMYVESFRNKEIDVQKLKAYVREVDCEILRKLDHCAHLDNGFSPCHDLGRLFGHLMRFAKIPDHMKKLDVPVCPFCGYAL